MTTLEEAISQLTSEFKEAQEAYERWEHNEAIYHLSTSPHVTEGYKGARKLLTIKCEIIKNHLDLVTTIQHTQPTGVPKNNEFLELSTEFVDEAFKRFEKEWGSKDMQSALQEGISELLLEDEVTIGVPT